MPGLAPPLTLDQARDQVFERCFAPSGSGRVGLECEWHVFDRRDEHRVVTIAELEELLAPQGLLPGGSRVTFEPGGQLELSSPPAAGVDAACAVLASDRDAVAAALDGAGLALVAAGVDPVRPPARQLRQPRYDAMERFFDSFGPAGRRMMCRTAALQLNVDAGAGDAQDAERRWRLAHLIGPALSASFATSPVAEGEATGWSSTRLATWLAIDPTRTAAVRGGRDAFVTYALDANVMLVRRDDAFEPIADRISFADWVRDGHALGRATADDLDYHLTTLFPPVRPRRWMEIRYFDALPDPWWRVAAAVVTTVLDDADAGAAAEAACAPCAARWCASARYGLTDPAFRRAALATVLAARDAFDRVGVSASIGRSCDDFVVRYLEPGRSLGDDVLDAWRAGRPLVAALEDLEDAWT